MMFTAPPHPHPAVATFSPCTIW